MGLVNMGFFTQIWSLLWCIPRRDVFVSRFLYTFVCQKCHNLLKHMFFLSKHVNIWTDFSMFFLTTCYRTQ